MSLQALCERSIRTGVRFAEDRETAHVRGRRQQFGPQAQRMIGGMARCGTSIDCRAPMRTLLPHLVGERLEGQAVVGGGQRTGQRTIQAGGFRGAM